MQPNKPKPLLQQRLQETFRELSQLLKASFILFFICFEPFSSFAQQLELLGELPLEPVINGETRKVNVIYPSQRAIDLIVDQESGQAIALRKPERNTIFVYTFNNDLTPRAVREFNLGELSIDKIYSVAAYLENNNFYVLVNLYRGETIYYGVLKHNVVDGHTTLMPLLDTYPSKVDEIEEKRYAWSSFVFKKKFYVLSLLRKTGIVNLQIYKGNLEIGQKIFKLTKENRDLLTYYESNDVFKVLQYPRSISRPVSPNSFLAYPPNSLMLSPYGDDLYLYRTEWKIDLNNKSDIDDTIGFFKITTKTDSIEYIKLPLKGARLDKQVMKIAMQDSVVVASLMDPYGLRVYSWSIHNPSKLLSSFGIMKDDSIAKKIQYYRRRSDIILDSEDREEKRNQSRTNTDLFSLYSIGGYYGSYLARDSSGTPLLFFISGRHAFFNYKVIYRSFCLRLNPSNYDLIRSKPGGNIDPNSLTLPAEQKLPTPVDETGSTMDELPNGDRMILSYDATTRTYKVFRLRLN